MSTPKLSVSIMAHPSRKEWVDTLLDGLPPSTQPIWDRYGDRWDTGRRALLSYDPLCTHHLVLQDDVLIAKDLCPGIEKALSLLSCNVPLVLYAGNGPTFRGQVAGLDLDSISWWVMPTVIWGPAIVVPTSHVPAIVEFGDKLNDVNYDTRIGLWYEARQCECWYPFPSWVEHRDEGSLIGHRKGRKALRFIGQENSCLHAELQGKIIDIGWQDS